MSLFQAPQQRTPNPQAVLRQQVMMLETSPRRMTEALVKQWEQAFDLMWGSHQGITPSQRLESLGTDAAELFEANTQLVTFIASILTGRDDVLLGHIMAKVATIPAYTVAKDGAVTLD